MTDMKTVDDSEGSAPVEKQNFAVANLGTDDFGQEFVDSAASQNLLDEGKKLDFARQILLVLAMLFLAGMILDVAAPTCGKEVFETCKTILPPIATLVIGSYFGKK